MATRRLVILAAALFVLLAAPRPAFPSTTYVVRKGDTLSEISKRFHVPAEKIRAANGLRSARILAGKKLRIPRKDVAERAAGRERPPAALAACAPSPVTEEELHEAALPLPSPPDTLPESMQARLLRVAKKMLSTPYAWGGTSLTGMDCSGYVWKVFAMMNLDLPRSAREQYEIGSEVERDNLSVGDLVFFRTYAKYPSHVGIYLGNNRFIHASSRSRRVKISSLDQSYYEKRYIGAKRLLYGENDIIN
jgi:peptidoglycan DL-endopeptidase LytE